MKLAIQTTDATEMKNHRFHGWHGWKTDGASLRAAGARPRFVTRLARHSTFHKLADGGVSDGVCECASDTPSRAHSITHTRSKICEMWNPCIRVIRAIRGPSLSVASMFVLLAPALFARDFVTANDQARFIAGLSLPARSPLAPFTKDPAWPAHAAEMDAAWIKSEQRSLAKTRAWAGSYAPGGSAPCFYMFSGPDILYAHTIFPGASTYVLCGTEPVGAVPDITKMPAGNVAPALANVRRSLSNVLKLSYFITKDMRADLTGTHLGGVLPIFYFFLARTGCEITSVDYVSLGSGGTLGKSGAPGVRIVFRSGFGAHTLYYFNADLANGGSGGAVMNFCRHLGSGSGLLKAASYLLHEDSFSQCRNFLLTNCRTIVQDDSGIPLRDFGARWQLRYFGHYAGTTGGIFAKYEQPDLAAAYAKVQPAELDFTLSYQWNPKTANILVATQTAAPKTAPAPVVTKATAPAAPAKKHRRKTSS